MPHISVSQLEYAPPGSASLFTDLTFSVSPGQHVALVGANGVGKSTLLRILAGELEADEGATSMGGTALYMPQDAGMSDPSATLRELLIEIAPPALRDAGRAMVAAEKSMLAGDDDGVEFAARLSDWGDLGGYELEGTWEAAVQRSVKTTVDDVNTRLVGELSGGERKRLLLDVLFTSGADVLLLDEPDNYLDVPTRAWLEDQIRSASATILMVSHDRTLLSTVATSIVCMEGHGCWVHGASYATFPEAREQRQAKLGDDLERWKAEERRLYQHMKIMKQRAAVNFKNASKADAAETRWKRFLDAGPPPPPVPDQHIRVRLRGADSARRVIRLADVAVDDLFFPFSHEVYFGERVGVIGPNGTGKTHLLDALDGTIDAESERVDGRIDFGPRTNVGRFTQVNDRPGFRGRTSLDIVTASRMDEERGMKSLAQYRLGMQARQTFETLSGGQKARLEILCLELDGHNVLLLDEPTDNLDIDSAEALEEALDGFEGTVLAVSHDRAFLSQLDRFVMITDDGEVLAIPDFDLAMKALSDPGAASTLRLVEPLTG